MKPFEIAGTLYDKEATKALREELIVIRDEVLGENNFYRTVCLSHVIGIMAKFIEQMES